MLNIINVSKTYGKSAVKAVDNVSLEIDDGEVFGFLGPNGAGKSTIIKMLCGVLPPDSGDIRIDDYYLKSNPLEVKKLIGYVPDNHAVYEKLTGMEYLNFIADVFNMPQNLREEKIKYYLDKFTLTDAANNQISTYSHGMKQKICVIAALIHSPKVWVLDEPLLGLDPQSAFNLKEMMREHAAQKNIVFFSSHVLDVVEKLCDRIAIIDKGKIIAVGTLKDLQKQGSTLEQYFLALTNTSNTQKV